MEARHRRAGRRAGRGSQVTTQQCPTGQDEGQNQPGHCGAGPGRTRAPEPAQDHVSASGSERTRPRCEHPPPGVGLRRGCQHTPGGHDTRPSAEPQSQARGPVSYMGADSQRTRSPRHLPRVWLMASPPAARGRLRGRAAHPTTALKEPARHTSVTPGLTRLTQEALHAPVLHHLPCSPCTRGSTQPACLTWGLLHLPGAKSPRAVCVGKRAQSSPREGEDEGLTHSLGQGGGKAEGSPTATPGGKSREWAQAAIIEGAREGEQPLRHQTGNES